MKLSGTRSIYHRWMGAAGTATLNALHVLAAPALQVFSAKPNGMPQSEGTAVALRIGSQLLLLTADHVLTVASTLYVMDSSRILVPLTCNNTARVPAYDVAVLRLSQAMTQALNWVVPATMSQLRLTKPAPGLLATFIGYPSGPNAPNIAKNKATPRPYAYSGRTMNPAAYVKYGYVLGRHVLIPFTFKGTDLETGVAVTFPNPHGMSGGPVWLLKKGAWPKLMGIGLELAPAGNPKVMVAGLIRWWIAAICGQWKDLEALIRR